MQMQMIGHTRTGALSEVPPDIESLCFHRFAKQPLPMHGQAPKLEYFIFT